MSVPNIVQKMSKTVKDVSTMTPEQLEAIKVRAQEQTRLRAQELAKKTQEENTKKIAELKKQNRNRNLWIAGGMVVGALGGFFIARYFKAKTLGLVLSTVGGSVAVGVPIILATRKKAVARRTEIEALNTANNAVATTTSVVDNVIKTVETVIPTVTPPPSGTDESKTTNQPKMA